MDQTVYHYNIDYGCKSLSSTAFQKVVGMMQKIYNGLFVLQKMACLRPCWQVAHLQLMSCTFIISIHLQQEDFLCISLCK